MRRTDERVKSSTLETIFSKRTERSMHRGSSPRVSKGVVVGLSEETVSKEPLLKVTFRCTEFLSKKISFAGWDDGEQLVMPRIYHVASERVKRFAERVFCRACLQRYLSQPLFRTPLPPGRPAFPWTPRSQACAVLLLASDL
jgi:hypothetical protein